MSKNQQWHEFRPEFVLKLTKACGKLYRIENLKYEIVIGKYWTAHFDISGVSPSGKVGMKMETRIGPKPSLESLEKRLIEFLKN